MFQSDVFDKCTQYEDKERNHIGIGTVPLIYDHRETQIDPLHINHQQVQTEFSVKVRCSVSYEDRGLGLKLMLVLYFSLIVNNLQA